MPRPPLQSTGIGGRGSLDEMRRNADAGGDSNAAGNEHCKRLFAPTDSAGTVWSIQSHSKLYSLCFHALTRSHVLAACLSITRNDTLDFPRVPAQPSDRQSRTIIAGRRRDGEGVPVKERHAWDLDPGNLPRMPRFHPFELDLDDVSVVMLHGSRVDRAEVVVEAQETVAPPEQKPR